MEDYKNMVCATDFSDNCRMAAERATDMARRYDAQLTLLHVVEHFPEDRANVAIAPEDVDPAAYREQRARNALEELARHLDYGKLVQEIRFSTCSAKHEIVCFAEERNTDLIVIASHGCQGITAILGSTAYGVAHSSPCDVLTVRARA
jgi:universal stress protein A